MAVMGRQAKYLDWLWASVWRMTILGRLELAHLASNSVANLPMPGVWLA